MKLTAGILRVLRSAQPAGNLLYLPGRLDTGLYRRVDAALKAAGASWDKRQQAYVFPGAADAAVTALCAEGQVTTAHEHKQAAQFFPTPPEVARRLISLAGLGPGHRVLEPSAGTGAIAEVAAPFAASVDCIEQDPGYAALIQAGGYARTLTVADFLGVPAAPAYDRVLMNPPFARGADVTHVRHALRFVKPGGRLVAVMLAGLNKRKSRAARALCREIEELGGWLEDLPAGAFAGSGTPVETVIVVIPVPGPAVRTLVPGVGEAVRVTTDYADYTAPLFRPAVEPPGVYVRYSGWHRRDVVFRFTGSCVGCGTGTWAHDDEDDDVRGPFGPNTCVPLTCEDFNDDEVPAGARFPRCGACWSAWDDDDHRLAVLDRALASLSPAPSLAAPPGHLAQGELFTAAQAGPARKTSRPGTSRPRRRDSQPPGQPALIPVVPETA